VPVLKKGPEQGLETGNELRQSFKRGRNKDWRQEMMCQSLKRGLNKDWRQKMIGQSLKRGLNKDWRQKMIC
jgi:hypothetical protein